MRKGEKVRKVVLIDIPTYRVSLPELHRKIIEKRLLAHTSIWESRTQKKLLRPALTYSRGLLTIAAVLERKGYSVKYLNYSDPADRLKILDFAKECDIAGITAYTPTINLASKICNQIKKVNSEITTIMGGAHVTAKPRDVLENCIGLDFAMIGECENRFSELLESLEKPDLIGGTFYRDDERGIHFSSAIIKPVSVSELPNPAYHLLNRPLRQYAHNIKTVRGCPYKCNFCFERNTSHPLSSHSFDQILGELTNLSKNIETGSLVHFSDAVFNLNWNYTGELVDRIKHLDSGLFFSFDTRVDLIDEMQIRELANAGFVNVRMGFESVRNEILELSKKSITFNKQLEASQTIRNVNHNMAIHAYMITGLPGTTRTSLALDIMQIYDLIGRDVVDTIGNKILVPYPGTDDYDKALDLGIIITTHDWSKYDRRSFPVYRLNNMSSEEIYTGYLLQEATLTESYIAKMKGSFPKAREIRQGLDYIYNNYALRSNQFH